MLCLTHIMIPCRFLLFVLKIPKYLCALALVLISCLLTAVAAVSELAGGTCFRLAYR